MRSERKGAAAPTAALKNALRNKAYQKSALESTAKSQIGEFLLYLSARNRRGRGFWQCFEAELRGGVV
jgi:hypothetical protein